MRYWDHVERRSSTICPKKKSTRCCERLKTIITVVESALSRISIRAIQSLKLLIGKADHQQQAHAGQRTQEGWVGDEDIRTDGGPILGFFDGSQPQPDDNSRRVWDVDDPHSEREGVKTHDSAVGFCALTGESLVTFTEDEKKSGCAPCKRAHHLGIDLIVIPSGSPQLHPSEQVWDSLKWTMAPIVVEDEDEFKDLVQETFEKIPHRISFAKKWCEKFLDFQKLS